MNPNRQLSNQTTVALTDKSKGQKIVAALYLLTNHLPDLDPFKLAIRQNAIGLLTDTENRLKNTRRIVDLLNSASLAGLIKEENVNILDSQLDQFINIISAQNDPNIQTIFDSLMTEDYSSDFNKGLSLKNSNKTTTNPIGQNPNTISKTITKTIRGDSNSNAESRAKRQEQILSFINTHKSVGIKDIAALFPDVSEKTIQREIATLVDKGLITKRGNKRWSIYLAI